MSHNFNSIKTSTIPDETKANLPEYKTALFSNDATYDENGKQLTEPSRILLDAYNEQGKSVVTQETINNWLQWSENPEAVIAVMMHPDNVINYTKNELKTERLNPKSIWYTETEVG